MVSQQYIKTWILPGLRKRLKEILLYLLPNLDRQRCCLIAGKQDFHQALIGAKRLQQLLRIPCRVWDQLFRMGNVIKYSLDYLVQQLLRQIIDIFIVQVKGRLADFRQLGQFLYCDAFQRFIGP